MANADSIEQQSSAEPQSCDSFNLSGLWSAVGGVAVTLTISTLNLDPGALPFANDNVTDLSGPLITIGSPANAQLLPGDSYCDFKYQPFDYTYCLNNYRDPKRINRSNVAELVRWAEQYKYQPSIKRILVHYIEMQNKSNFGDVGAIGNSEDLYSFVTRPALWRSIPQQDLAEARKVFHQIASEFSKDVIFPRFKVQYPADVGNYSLTLFTYLNSQTVLGIEMSYDNYLNNDNQQTAVYRKYMARMQEVDRHKLNHWKQYYSRLVNRFRKEKDLAFLTDMMTNLQNTIVPWKSEHFQFLPNMHVRSDLMFTDLTSPSLTSFDYNVNRQLVEQRNAKYKEYFFAEILPDVLEEIESAISDLEAQGVRYYDNPYALLTGIVALAIDIAPARGASRLANIGKRGGYSGRIINQADDIATSGRNKPNRGRTNTTEGVPCVADLDTSKIAEGFDAREWIVAGLNYINTDIGWLETRVYCPPKNWQSQFRERFSQHGYFKRLPIDELPKGKVRFEPNILKGNQIDYGLYQSRFGKGLKDRFGNIWTPDTSTQHSNAFHFDVQTKIGQHFGVFPDGTFKPSKQVQEIPYDYR